MDALILMKRWLWSAVGVLALLCSHNGTLTAQAQDRVEINTPVQGIVAPGSSQSWTFNAQAGQVLSFLVEAIEDEFDPIVTLSDRSGRVLISNDDYAYPETRDALLEAITLARTEPYTVTVSGFAGSGGTYQLIVTPGFAQRQQLEGQQASKWQSTSPDLTVRRASDAVELRYNGVAGVAAAAHVDEIADADAAVRARFSDISGTGWIVGLTVRQRGADYYLLSINHEGRWRFSVVEDGTPRVIRDWTGHPNIVPGQTTFTLMLMASAAGFDFFYNDGYIGSSAETSLTEPGTIGIAAGTTASLPAEVTARVDQLSVTTRLRVAGERLIPQALIVGDSATMTQALLRRHVVSALGSLSLTVPESTVEFARPGINRLMLGRGVRYANFALGATVTMSATNGVAGCGLVVRFTDGEDYTLAYLDASGGHGVSQRRGDTFSRGLFAENPAFAGGGSHHLLVIADMNTLYYYIDGQLIGTLDDPHRAGEVGTAVVNFEGGPNTCRFTNLWVWEWD